FFLNIYTSPLARYEFGQYKTHPDRNSWPEPTSDGDPDHSSSLKMQVRQEWLGAAHPLDRLRQRAGAAGVRHSTRYSCKRCANRGALAPRRLVAIFCYPVFTGTGPPDKGLWDRP